jgi:hypothetical protein
MTISSLRDCPNHLQAFGGFVAAFFAEDWSHSSIAVP